MRESVPKFLVVAEDASTARTLTQVCSRYGTCTLSDSPAAALGVLHGLQPVAGLIVERELRLGSALDVAARARQLNVPTLMLSAMNSHRSVHEAYQVGARYLCKPVETPELEMFVSAAAALARSGTEAKRRALTAIAERAGLTPRETEVVALALDNLPRASMAEAMGISESTLKFHIRSLLDKCDAPNLSTLVRTILLQLEHPAP